MFRFLFQWAVVLLTVMAVTTVMLWLAGAPPLDAYYHLFLGSLGSWTKFARVIQSWIPLTLCACGLLYTFRIGLWNIGVEGQVMMGAVAATFVLRAGVHGHYPPGLYLGMALLGGIAGGAVWAILVGLLKTHGGVNEIFAGLGLNFVSQGMILWLILGPWKRPGISSMSGTEMFPPELWLPFIPSWRLSHLGLGITLAAFLLTLLILKWTRIGLCFKAIGGNPRAACLFGLKPDRYLLLAMILGGGLAGLAGSVQVTGVYHRLIPSISANYGYLALLVVMLANYKVGWVPFVSLFFACLNVGSIQLPMVLKIDSSLSGVIQGTLVLTALGIHGIWASMRQTAAQKMTSEEPANG